jgi:hypothetical protein
MKTQKQMFETQRKTPTQFATAVEAKDWRGVVIGCIVVCILGVAVRYPLLTKGGHSSDLGFFASWANTIHEHGLANVYHKSPKPANYPVGFMHIFHVFNGCASLFGEPAGRWNERNIEKPFKVLLCIGDIAVTVCLVLGGYWLGASCRRALLAGSCYMLNPAVIMITGLWGQTNAIAVGLMVAALIFLCSRYWPVAYLLAAVGCNTKLQVVPLLPLLPLATILLYPHRDWMGRIKAAAFGAILFLLTTVLLFYPFIVAGTTEKAVSVGYSSHFESDPALNRNAWNPWSVCVFPNQHILSIPPLLVQLGRRVPWLAPIVSLLTYWRISVLLFCAVAMVTYFCWIKRPSKQFLFFAASVIAVAFFLLMTKIHERYLLDAIPLLLLAAVLDRRAFGLCGIVSIISALNVEWHISLLAPVGALILGIVLVRMVLVVLTPQATVGWPWEIALRRKRWLDLPTITYITAGGLWLAFSCPWAFWFSSLTHPNTLYFDELQLLDYRSEDYCPFRPYSGSNNQLLVVEGEQAGRGLSIPPDAIARFSIPRGYNSFHAAVGISDQVSNNLDVRLIFMVGLNGRVVFRSEVVHPRSPGQEVSIPLGQAGTIDLITVDANKEGRKPSTGDCRYAVWMNARIQKDF